jgi:hypothetical protein
LSVGYCPLAVPTTRVPLTLGPETFEAVVAVVAEPAVVAEVAVVAVAAFPEILPTIVRVNVFVPVKVLFSGRMEADDPPMEIHVQGGNGEVWQRCSVLSLML